MSSTNKDLIDSYKLLTSLYQKNNDLLTRKCELLEDGIEELLKEANDSVIKDKWTAYIEYRKGMDKK